MDRRPATDHRGAITGLELFEPGAVNNATDDLADLERLAEVLADESEEFFGIERRRIGLQRRRRIGLVPVEVRHDFAAQTDGVHLVVSEVLGQAGDLGVLLRAANRLGVGDLTGGHLHQRRAGEEGIGLLLDEDVVIAQTRLVRPASGRRAEGDTHRRDLHLGEFDHLVKESTGLREMCWHNGGTDRPVWVVVVLRLVSFAAGTEIATGGLDETDVRDAVVAGDLECPHPLLGGVGRERTGGDRRIVAHDHALDTGDDADAGDHATAEVVRAAVASQRGDLEERGVGIEGGGDALTDLELAAAPMTIDCLLPAGGGRHLEQLVVDRKQLAHVLPVLEEEVTSVSSVDRIAGASNVRFMRRT